MFWFSMCTLHPKSNNSVHLFTQITNFVLRCLHRRGFVKSLVYLDDFLVTGSTREECEQAQLTLISILRSLGFNIAWPKCVSPSQNLEYLGVRFDTTSMTASLPPAKMAKLHHELAFFAYKSRATKKQLQRLCGIISHCSKVIRGGRTFSRRRMDMLKRLPKNNIRIRLTQEFMCDLRWWQECSKCFNGVTIMMKFNDGHGPIFTTDASINGYGPWSGSDWQAGYFNSYAKPEGWSDDRHC